MIKFVLRRALSLIPMLIGVSLLVFLLMYASPGDFLSEARSSKDISPEIVKQEEIRLGLDKPWYVQYGRWLNGVSPVKTSLLLPDEESKKHSIIYFGLPDFGYSWSYKVPVVQLIGQRIMPTLRLAICAMLLTYAVAIPLGVLAAVKKDSAFDKLSAFLAYASLSVPYFFLALLAVLFAAITGIFPTGGQSSIMYDFLSPPEKFADIIRHLALPSIVLSVGGIASTMRIMRGNFLEYSRSEFVTTARAKGLAERAIMFKHVLRNALNPIITAFGFEFAGLLSGALLVENVMNYPGLGQLIYSAIVKQDQYVVMAGVVMGCVMLVSGQLLADVLLAVADPRIRLGGERAPAGKMAAIFAALLLAVVVFSAVAEKFPETFEFIATAAKWSGIAFGALLIAAVAAGLAWAAAFFYKNFLFEVLKSVRGCLAFIVLALLYLSAIFAPFLAPYPPTEQNLEKSFHPPSGLVFKNGSVYAKQYVLADASSETYEAVSEEKVEFFIFDRNGSFKLFGLNKSAPPDARIYLLGSDSTGRDVFSRLLYGARVSLSIGFVGIAITLVAGFIIGGLSGYFGGTFDFACMRIVEFLMAIPGLYLLLAMRSALAPHFDSAQMYIMIVVILAAIGWTGAARVIRGMSLSLASRQYVQAAKGMGERPIKIILRHFLPNVLSYLIVAATLSIPGYVLSEAALSFLGLGIQEPSASWGLMLSQAQNDTKVLMLGFWWLLLPGAAIFVTVLAFNVLGDVLRDISDPKNG